MESRILVGLRAFEGLERVAEVDAMRQYGTDIITLVCVSTNSDHNFEKIRVLG